MGYPPPHPTLSMGRGMFIKQTFMDAHQLVSFGESHVLKETVDEL